MTPDAHSYTYLVWMGFLDRIRELPIFGSIKYWAKTPMTRIQPENVPFFGCYLLEERSTPDGDPNAGEPRFVHLMKLGFSMIIFNSDETKMVDTLDAAHWSIMNLLSQPDWHRFPFPAPYKTVHIEAVMGFNRKNKYGNTLITNEQPAGELQMDMTFKFRSGFPPIITDDFKTMHVEVQHPWPYDPDAYAPDRLRVEIDIPQNEEEATP